MPVPPLSTVGQFETFISGDVVIDPSAAIAPGVILRADPDSRIVIHGAVCLGMGVVLHAHGGVIEINGGSNLGSGVLVVGHSYIGPNTCIGAASTIYGATVPPGQVIPAGAVIGDISRQVALPELPSAHEDLGTQLLQGSKNGFSPVTPVESGEVSPDADALEADPWEPEEVTPQLPEETKPETTAPESVAHTYIGQMYVNRLMVTLFPHQQKFQTRKQKPDV